MSQGKELAWDDYIGGGDTTSVVEDPPVDGFIKAIDAETEPPIDNTEDPAGSDDIDGSKVCKISDETIKVIIDFLQKGDPKNALATLEAEMKKGRGAGISWADLQECRFDPNNPPEHLPATILLNKIPIAHPGNIITFSGLPKSGKSQGIAAILASSLAPDPDARDTLGFCFRNPEQKAVIYIDCEQSRRDSFNMLTLAMRRARVDKRPDWFHAYNLRGYEPGLILATLWCFPIRMEREHGGIRAIFIDGYADLIKDPNDAEESFELIRKLMAMSEEIKAPICGVLHYNPGSDSKIRGHLGSQAERKSETVLSFKKSPEEIFTVWTKTARGKPISENDGARFEFDKTVGMFKSISSKSAVKRGAKFEELKRLALDAMGNHDELRHTDLQDRIMNIEAVSERTARTRIKQMRDANLVRINRETDNYTLGYAAADPPKEDSNEPI
ncbi:hypothetical protein JXA40_04495 [bacterium]|nr:hypothetical protein [candidate division CSSED10-310 bacterium]